MARDEAYLEAEKKIKEARRSDNIRRPDRFPRDARIPESPFPHTTRLTTARIKPVRSGTPPTKGGHHGA